MAVFGRAIGDRCRGKWKSSSESGFQIMPVYDFLFAQLPTQIGWVAINHGRKIDQTFGSTLGFDTQFLQFINQFLQSFSLTF